MSNELKIAIIGLDTSHATNFPQRMQSPDVPADQKVDGMKAVTCMKFMTPFTTEEVLAERTAQLESWGVKVTESFDEAVADCDAILLEVNDPTYHLDFFTKCAELGKPIFLDKPMADTIENAMKIHEIAKAKGVRYFTSSSLRFVAELEQACEKTGPVTMASIYGPLGKALAGSSIVWYGVHAFEMLERAMGTGAAKVTSVKDAKGVVVTVEYKDGRRGIVELTEGDWRYGGCLKSEKETEPFLVDMSGAYSGLLRQVVAFLKDGAQPVAIEDSLEVMKMLDAAEKSFQTGSSINL